MVSSAFTALITWVNDGAVVVAEGAILDSFAIAYSKDNQFVEREEAEMIYIYEEQILLMTML